MHYDLRYALLADALDPTPPDHESPEAYRVHFDEAPRRAEPTLSAALIKLGAVVAK